MRKYAIILLALLGSLAWFVSGNAFLESALLVSTLIAVAVVMLLKDSAWKYNDVAAEKKCASTLDIQDHLTAELKKTQDEVKALREILDHSLMPVTSVASLTQTPLQILKDWAELDILSYAEMPQDTRCILSIHVVEWLTDEDGIIHLYDDFHKPLIPSDILVEFPKHLFIVPDSYYAEE